jgi:hypothetical protein
MAVFHVLVGDEGSAAVLAAFAGRFLAFEGLDADVVAVGSGHRGGDGEHDSVVGARAETGE